MHIIYNSVESSIQFYHFNLPFIINYAFHTPFSCFNVEIAGSVPEVILKGIFLKALSFWG